MGGLTPLAPVRKVAVVGGGPSGLTAAREFLRVGLCPVVYEARSGLGGAWSYQADPGRCRVVFDPEGHCSMHSDDEQDERPSVPATPMYDDLVTNLPKELMTYRGHPFGTAPVFPSRAMVEDYIQDFATEVSACIRFKSFVSWCAPPTTRDGKWTVTVKKPAEGSDPSETESEAFDAVVIATGKYTVPLIPRIEGLSSFKGRLIHSRWYRNAKAFYRERVLVVGAWASGSDIARELVEADLGIEVYQSVRDPAAFATTQREMGHVIKWLEGIHVRGEMTHVADLSEGSRISFKSGSPLEDIDSIIFATGYRFSYPMLPREIVPGYPLLDSADTDRAATERGLVSARATSGDSGLRLYNLYHGLLYRPLPSLAFMVTQMNIVPFPLAETQAIYLARLWSDPAQHALPTLDEMASSEARSERDASDGRLLGRAYHKMDPELEFSYHDQLLHEVHCFDTHGLEPWRRALRMSVRELRLKHLQRL